MQRPIAETGQQPLVNVLPVLRQASTEASPHLTRDVVVPQPPMQVSKRSKYKRKRNKRRFQTSKAEHTVTKLDSALADVGDVLAAAASMMMAKKKKKKMPSYNEDNETWMTEEEIREVVKVLDQVKANLCSRFDDIASHSLH